MQKLLNFFCCGQNAETLRLQIELQALENVLETEKGYRPQYCSKMPES